MPNPPTIVVPFEQAREMKGVIAAAVALGRGLGARVDVLEIVRPRRMTAAEAFGDHPVPPREPVREDDGRRTTRTTRAGEVRDVTYPGKPLEAIQAYAQVSGATMIVVGEHYGSPRWRRSTGFVATLSRTAPVPVLVLPRNYTLGRGPLTFRRVVAAADFTVASAVAVRTVTDLFGQKSASLTLVHALNAARHGLIFSGSERLEIERRLQGEAEAVGMRLRRQLAPECRFRVDLRVETGDPDRAILQVAEETDADLIVMGVSPRTRVDEAVFGSDMRRVLRLATVPVLVLSVPAGERPWQEG